MSIYEVTNRIEQVTKTLFRLQDPLFRLLALTYIPDNTSKSDWLTFRVLS